MWNEEYEKLTSYEKGEFRRIANYLLSHTYMVRFTYDSGKEMTLPNSDYSMLVRLFSVLQEYFEVTGWKLEKDDDYGIVSLISEFDNNRFKLNRFTTLFLYVCRLIYEENRENENSYHIVKTDTAAVVEKMRILGLLKGGKSTQNERIEAQRTLAHFNIIQKMESVQWSGDGNNILILPSILYVISNQSINAMIEQIEEMKLTVMDTEEKEDENTKETFAD
ncbi:MAG: DUF4194 domain-containing protein [Ruminococcus sp.]